MSPSHSTSHQGPTVQFTENFMNSIFFKREFNTIDRFDSISWMQTHEAPKSYKLPRVIWLISGGKTNQGFRLQVNDREGLFSVLFCFTKLHGLAFKKRRRRILCSSLISTEEWSRRLSVPAVPFFSHRATSFVFSVLPDL